ncbi:MAG: hypothetical protein HUU22_00765 [Phycisphaerae bacterium]|nr:hypothetical protein [Phycisphaerae bacterium]NUQ44546.1 hypothetical protein [Phycisphaerae bacterium]
MSTQPAATDMPAPSVEKPFDPVVGLQVVLLFDVMLRLFVWSASLAAALWLVGRLDLWAWPAGHEIGTGSWSIRMAALTAILMVLFNVAYILVLTVLRTFCPTPKPGRYSLTSRKPDPNLIWSCFTGLLTKARYQAPFPAFLVPQLANVAPFRWLMNWRFGPRSGSCFFVEPNILDPHLITIGRNVTIGFGTTVSAHVQERDTLSIQPTIIEDDVLVGAHVGIAGGVHIKRGAVVRGFSMVLPGTVIPENEYWAGIPARRVKDLAAPAER